jgi:methylmalonyl-CoA decarboxylase subunit alpha
MSVHDPVYRLAPGLLVSMRGDGVVVVWRPRQQEPYALDADLLALLSRFASGATRAEAAAAAGVDDDGTVAEVVEVFVAAGLLLRLREGETRIEVSRDVARARVEEIADPGSFAADTTAPVVTGVGSCGGRRVAFVAWEPMSMGGIESVLALQDRVAREPCPIVYLFDLFSIGHDADAEFLGARSVGRIYANMARLGAVVPQIGVVYGTLFRPAAFPPGLCDLVVFMERDAFVHVGDVDAVKEFTGADVRQDELGGAKMHAEISGLADRVVRSPGDAADLVRRWLALVPTSAAEDLPISESKPPGLARERIDAWIPDETSKPFDVLPLITSVVDGDSLVEIASRHAPELVTALARLEGIPVGIVANQSKRHGGVLTVQASDKAARFVTFCDRFRIPLVFLADVPGFAIGLDAERAGIERAAGRLFTAIARATVPRLTLVVRRAHTAGLYAMCGPAFDPDAFLALPGASIAIFGERANVHGALERSLDADSRAALRTYLRSQRPPASRCAEIVEPAQVRGQLASRIRALLASRVAR